MVPDPKVSTIKVWDKSFEVVRKFKEPKEIKLVQDVFLRVKKAGDTSARLKSRTRKIDFSDRWVVDLNKGEVGILSKSQISVCRLKKEDLLVLQKRIKTKA